MGVVKGEEITELVTGKVLIVENSYSSKHGSKPSPMFDFLATYTTAAGETTGGQKLHGNRGFSLVDEGEIWVRR